MKFPANFQPETVRLAATSPETRPIVEDMLTSAVTLRDEMRTTRATLVAQRERAKELLAEAEARLKAFEGDLAEWEERTSTIERILADTSGERRL
jgi:hypothetical protein